MFKLTEAQAKKILSAMIYANQLCSNEADQRGKADTDQNYGILAYRATEDLDRAIDELESAMGISANFALPPVTEHYTVEIEEPLIYTVEVEATSESEARAAAMKEIEELTYLDRAERYNGSPQEMRVGAVWLNRVPKVA